MTAIVTADKLVPALAQRINAGADASVSGPNKQLKDAMVAKNFFTEAGGGSGPTTTPTLQAVTTAGSSTSALVTFNNGADFYNRMAVFGATPGSSVRDSAKWSLYAQNSAGAGPAIVAYCGASSVNGVAAEFIANVTGQEVLKITRGAPDSARTTMGAITYNGSGVLYNSVSDYRLKENIKPITNGIETVLKLKPVNYTWKHNDGPAVDGFIAHELQEVIPTAVSGVKDDVNADGTAKYQGIDVSYVIPCLTAAVQTLITRVQDLEQQVLSLSKG